MPLALLLNNKEYGDREIRVTRYLSNPVAVERQKERDAARNGRKKGKKQLKEVESSQAPGNAKKVFEKTKKETIPYEKKEKKEKKERKGKKEKTTKLSFMGHKSSMSINGINAMKRLMKKAKK